MKKFYALSLALPLVFAMAACGSTSRAPVSYRFVVSGSTIAPGDPSAFKGQSVTFSITTDKDEEVHLHGYDIHFDCKSGVALTKTFTADKTGTFEMELEATSTHLTNFTVQP